MVSLVMRWFVLISLMLSTADLQAQDWSLFPKNALGIHHRGVVNEPILLMRIDLEEDDKQYVNFFPNNNSDTLCLKSFYESIDDTEFDPGFQPGYTVIRFSGDTTFWHFNTEDSLVFLPGIQTGESWMFMDVQYTCVLEDTSSVFGLPDSIKIFELSVPDHPSSDLNGETIVLSKHYGLVSYPPVDWLISGETEDDLGWIQLVGLETDAGNYGQQLPDWKQFFPYESGDILTWDYHNNDVMYGDHYTYQFYILSKTTWPDSVRIDYLKKIESDSGFVLEGPFSSTYTYDYFGQVLHPNGNNLFFHLNSDGAYDYQFPVLEVPVYKGIHQDTLIIDLKYSVATYLQMNPAECALDVYVDGSINKYWYSSVIGLYSKLFGGFSSVTESLIGFHIGDSIWGVTEFPTSIVPQTQAPFVTYPNPASVVVHLSGYYPDQPEWQIIDIQGRIQMNGVLRENELDISLLPSGYYYLYLHGVGGAGFVKE